MKFDLALIPFLITFFAGSATVLGAFLVVLFKKIDKEFLSFSLGVSAGVMIYVSFVELMSGSIKFIGFKEANIYFMIGLIIMYAIDRFTPYHEKINLILVDKKDKKIIKLGIFTAIALAIHNLPEGLSVFLTSYANLKLGLTLFVAIALHNIPEGLAVAIPIYFATRKKGLALGLTFLSGMTEPLGALICFFVFGSFITNSMLYYVSALTAGIMVYISFDELLPASLKHQKEHNTILGVITGMIFAAVSLTLF